MSERNYWQRMCRSRLSRRALLRASGRAAINEDWLAAHPPHPESGWASAPGTLPSKQFSKVASP